MSRRIHAYLSIRRQAVTQAQREAIAARGIEWETYPARDVGGQMRLLIELWGEKESLAPLFDPRPLLRDPPEPATGFLVDEGFEPILCAAFVEVDGLWVRLRQFQVNRAAFADVAPDLYDEQLQALRQRLPTDRFLPPRWFSGRPLPDEDGEEPEE